MMDLLQLRQWSVWGVLSLLWLAALPSRSLMDPDEGRYAEIPREMLDSGDWVTPHLNGVKYFEKPPLQYWMTAASYRLFGVNEISSRLWAMLTSFLCLPLVYGFLRSSGESTAVAWSGTGILAVSPFFGLIGQINLLDQGFSFFLVGAVFAYLLAQRHTEHLPEGRRRRHHWMLLCWAMLALAVLSKGIAALVLPGATLGLYMLFKRDLSPLKRLHLGTGFALFALICLPWFALVQYRNPEFASFFFLHEHFARFLTTVHQRTQPLWFFPALVCIALLPVALSVPRWIGAWQRRKQPTDAFDANLFLVLWCTVVLVFFSASRSKLAPYILPMMPVLAVLLARPVAADRLTTTRAQLTLLVIVAVMGIGLATSCWYRQPELPRALALWVTLAMVIALAGWLASRYRKPAADEPTGWKLAALTAAAVYPCLIAAYAQLPPQRSGRSLADLVAEHLSAQTQLYSVGQFRHTLPFYLQRTLQLYGYTGELEFGLQQIGDLPRPGIQDFLQQWRDSHDAIAFIHPRLFDEFKAAGMPARVLGSDGRSIAVARQ
ncbi:glycosyltransferase family 39 protein [Steroidobacter denitrificans]|nr:glycosyltransferase family 39 protein [Steroidobacter denitrificans]